jgi:hypothetical protein
MYTANGPVVTLHLVAGFIPIPPILFRGSKGRNSPYLFPCPCDTLDLHDARALPAMPGRGKHGIGTARLAEIQRMGRQSTRAAPRPPPVRTTPTSRASGGKEKTRKAQALSGLARKRSAHYEPDRTLARTRRPRRPRPSCCRAFCLISSYNTTTTTNGWMDVPLSREGDWGRLVKLSG